jgi:ribosomal protein L24
MQLFSKGNRVDAFGNRVFVGDLVQVYLGGDKFTIGTIAEINQHNLCTIDCFGSKKFPVAQCEFRKITVEEATLLMLES